MTQQYPAELFRLRQQANLMLLAGYLACGAIKRALSKTLPGMHCFTRVRHAAGALAQAPRLGRCSTHRACDVGHAWQNLGHNSVLSAGYVPASWLHTPPCKAAPFPDDSVADSQYKVWGWQQPQKAKADSTAIELCAFKSDQQQPTPIDRRIYRLTWLDAPACVDEPEPSLDNSMPDQKGCLWGWQLDR